MKELKERGIKVPDEFGVIGFANEQFGEHITPTLSTVDQQTIHMGRSAITLLMNQIEKPGDAAAKSEIIVLEPLLICRDSSQRKTWKLT